MRAVSGLHPEARGLLLWYVIKSAAHTADFFSYYCDAHASLYEFSTDEEFKGLRSDMGLT